MALIFEHETKGQRVRFGAGRAATNLAAEIERLGAQAPFVVATDRHTPSSPPPGSEPRRATWE